MAENTLAGLPDKLLSEGRTYFTARDAARISGVPVVRVYPGLKRLTERGLIFSPARGFYVPIPSEFRTWGSVPATHFIDPMMNHLGRRYYVGLLSAAELHGAAHQRPQAFQVMVDRALTGRRIGRADLRFYVTSKFEPASTVQKATPTGSIAVATPEIAVLDLASRPRDGAGLGNVASVVIELAEEGLLNVDALADASRRYSASAVRRVGWLLDHYTNIEVSRLDPRDSAPTTLDPHGGRRGPIDPTWQIIVNTDVEPDL